MKKCIIILMIVFCIMGLSACGGNVKNVQITEYSSNIYSNSEIGEAIEVTLEYFKKEFDGCTLTEISYYGDDKLLDFQDFAERNNATEVIVFVSTFDVDESGGDGSLNPNDTYKNWKWILVRSEGGKWKHVDHGY